MSNKINSNYCKYKNTIKSVNSNKSYGLEFLNFSLQIKYKSDADKMKSKYTVVMDTPIYVQNILSGLNASEVSVSPPILCVQFLHRFRKCVFNICSHYFIAYCVQLFGPTFIKASLII